MANPRIRCPVLYSGTTKVGELQDVDYTLSSNREAEFTSEGYMTHSDGNVMTGLTAGVIVTTAGFTVDFVQTLLDAGSVSMGLPIGNRYHTSTMVVTEASFKGDTKANTCKGSFKFEGGPPSLV